MKTFKFAALSAVVVLMTGCMGLSEDEREIAQWQVASEFYRNHLKANYSAFAKKVMVDQVSGETITIEPLDTDTDTAIIKQCEGKFALNDNDVEKNGYRFPTYKLIPTAKVDTTAFNQCVDKYLKTYKLDAESLDLLVNNSDFKAIRQQPDFAKKIEEIKQDDMISLHETLEILSIMQNHENNVAKADYQSKVKGL